MRDRFGRSGAAPAEGHALPVTLRRAVPIATSFRLQTTAGNRAVTGLLSSDPSRTMVVQRNLDAAKVAVAKDIGDERAVSQGQFFLGPQVQSIVETEFSVVLMDSKLSPADQKQAEEDFAKLATLASARRKFSAEWQAFLKDLKIKNGGSVSRFEPFEGPQSWQSLKAGWGIYDTAFRSWEKNALRSGMRAAGYLNLSALAGLARALNVACEPHARRMAARLYKRRGPGKATAAFSKTTVAAGVKRYSQPSTPGYTPHDVATYQPKALASAVAKVNKALDNKLVVLARVMSGVGGLGTSAQLTNDHAILIVARQGDTYLFVDPDATQSKEGFGKLYYDTSVPRLSTAKNPSDIVCSEQRKVGWGNHKNGQHRYQVLTLETV